VGSLTMADGTVALCMPAYNRADLVAETLDSVLAQKWPLWELRVVDDGSTDRTKEIVAQYAARDGRILLSDRQGEPKGACTCRNEAVLATSAEYVMFLDTDDIIEPFCLEQRVRAMETDRNLDFAIFPGLMFEKRPGDLGVCWNIDKPETDELTRQFRQDAIAQGTGILFRRDSFLRIGMWDTSLHMWQDVDLFFKAFIQGYRYAKFFNLPPDLHNRTNHGSLSRKGFFAREKQDSRARVVRNAVALLRAHGMEERIPEARFMAAGITLGAARSGYATLALEMLTWAASEGVIDREERRRLALAVWIHRLRLTKIGPSRRCAENIAACFRADATIGKLPYK